MNKELTMLICIASLQNEYCGLINCCAGKPVALKDKVEEFKRNNG